MSEENLHLDWPSWKVYLRAPQAVGDHDTGRKFFLTLRELDLTIAVSSWYYLQLWWTTPCCHEQPLKWSEDGFHRCRGCRKRTHLTRNGWRNDRPESLEGRLENLLEAYGMDSMAASLASQALAERLQQLRENARIPRSRTRPYAHTPESFTAVNRRLAHFYSRRPLNASLRPIRELELEERRRLSKK